MSRARRSDSLDSLTRREMDILRLLGEGLFRLRNLMNPAQLLENERMQISLRQQLGEASFACAFAEGAEISIEDALIYALGA